MTAALEWGEWSAARPGRTLPPGKTRYPFYRRLGGPQGWSRRAENLVPTGIRSWTVLPVALSLYRLSYPKGMLLLIKVEIKFTLEQATKAQTEYRRSYNLSGPWRYMGVDVQHHAAAALPPGKRSSSHCTGGWVGPRAVLYGCGNPPPPIRPPISLLKSHIFF